MLYPTLLKTIEKSIILPSIPEDRKNLLQSLVDVLYEKHLKGESIHLQFICTHNSRRSHLAQVWAQCATAYFQLKNINTYSAGTEATALYPKIAEVLTHQGFKIFQQDQTTNPLYSIQYSDECLPILGFSKTIDHPSLPNYDSIAVMTCSQANETCPILKGVDQIFSITFEDPKTSDDMPLQTEVYTERSIQIAREMFYVMQKLRHRNI